ncbi:RagB/SusD family nutrient uptake outer membrane protein [Sunxiuqinia sp. A32]|uniref:RagB/SusD family nutrient uptake outer membrane protein n=1 Tax=Sunxiuqinia sp. A32 TaxID=3461496 RepID=UPI004045DD41
MRNSLKILIFTSILTSILFTSCKDILTEDPQSFLSPENFPKTEKDAIAATTAAYSKLFSSAREFYVSFIPSDFTFQGFHNKRPLTYFVGLNGFNADCNSLWQEAYGGISRCNTAIDYIPLIEDMDETLQKRLVAEAKALRGYYYFGLVRKYGDVPIVDKVLDGANALKGITRKPVSEVYAFIEQDLKEAIPDLPDSYDNSEKGRVTKWAAAGILATTYLTERKWALAIEQCDAIINSGKFGLVADYNKLFGWQNEHQLFPDKDGALVNENIWDIQFTYDERGSTVTQQTGSRDKRVGGNSHFYGGFENMMPLPEFGDWFEPGDKRKAISFVESIDVGEPNGIIVLSSPTTPGAGPISGKYQNADSGVLPIPGNSPNNQYVVRYADVLLMRAEAENELNGPANAYQFINLVRERAGITPLSGLSKEEFTTALRKERATELSFEGHRRYDLLRWGIFVESIRNSTSPILEIPRENIQDYNVLLPVPNNEIAASNGSLEQNPGYN